MPVNQPAQGQRQRLARTLLPAQPIIEAVLTAAGARQIPVGRLLGDPILHNTFTRARNPRLRGAGRVTVATVDQLCARLGRHPAELYGDDYYAAAAMASARRRPALPPAGKIPLATYQALWDRMAETAVDGCWTGHLSVAINQLDPTLIYSSVRTRMLQRGWLRCERRGSGGPAGRPSVYRLLSRPAPASRPCERDGCIRQIPAVSHDGYLTHRVSRYCSVSCRDQAHHADRARRLDRLRQAAGLAATGRVELDNGEIAELTRLLRRRRMVAA